MTDLQFEAIEHGGQYPDTMPQAVLVTDAKGQASVYEVSASDKNLALEKRPQDPSLNGADLTFTIEAASVIPGNMPETIRETDGKGRTARYAPAGAGRVIPPLGSANP